MELKRQQAPFPHLRGGDGPAVILVPGMGGTTDFWAAQLPLLAEHYTVIAFDQRGSGARGDEPCCHSPADLVDDVTALIAELGDDPVILAGHSMGAATCQHAALADASSLRGLVMSSAWAGPTTEFRALIAARRAILETAGPDAYLVASAAIALTPDALAGGELDAAALAKRAGNIDVVEELGRLDALAAHDLRARVGEIELPVELLAAADDRLTPPAVTEDLAARLPQARLTMLEHGGHIAPQANATEYNDAFIRSLTRLLPATY